MCGIFGIIASKEASYKEKFLTKSLNKLAILSESRGKDSSGLCTFNPEHNTIEIVKGPISIKQLFKKDKLKNIVSLAFQNSASAKYAFGHARLVTNGTQLKDSNNQPVIKDGIVGIHNGIVVNVDELWEQHPQINRENEIDTEVLMALVRLGLKNGESAQTAISKSIGKVKGTVATALVFDDLNKFILATNNGSLYVLHNNKDVLFFASEHYILSKFKNEIDLSEIGNYQIHQIKSNNGIVIDLEDFFIKDFSFSDKNHLDLNKSTKSNRLINIVGIKSVKDQISTVIDLNNIHLNSNALNEKALLQYPIEKIKNLKRCKKCILPETFPFIKYDAKGICNYCNNYSKKKLKPYDELLQMVKPYRVGSKKEILLPYSGGRDSSYVLHYVKEELNLNVKTYTYDWGMVTDLARKNISRMCGTLGVENIIVAADIHTKRKNVRLNIKAWLKKPELGIVPLFMAGDKYFLYHANQVSDQNNIDLNMWGSNYLENTEFKTGFCGIRPDFDKERIDSLSGFDKIKLGLFFAYNYLINPSYFNSSIPDTIGSFFSRYLLKRKGFIQLFDYVKWDEKLVEDTIVNKYGWEKSIDTKSTWRIGDGTASFYNYIFVLLAGFSENDTFRSNQIREGLIKREEALDLIYNENAPRYNSLKWYFEILGIDYSDVIIQINKMKRKY